MSIRGSFRIALVATLLPSLANAGVPTATMPLDDEEIPAAPAPAPPTASSSPSATGTASSNATGTASSNATGTASSNATGTASSNATGTASSNATGTALTAPPSPDASLQPEVAPRGATPSPSVSADAAASMSVLPSALVPSATKPATGFARLSLRVREAGTTAYVFPRKDDPDDYAEESAVMRCATACSQELPQGEYGIRVVTADGVRSHGELSLQSARWISVAPASTVTRDFGFASGIVGTAATLLGVALLAEAICDKCTSSARNTGGAVALGVGLPLMAVGWSLYYIHRSAKVDEQILTQQARLPGAWLTLSRLPDGAAVTASLRF